MFFFFFVRVTREGAHRSRSTGEQKRKRRDYPHPLVPPVVFFLPFPKGRENPPPFFSKSVRDLGTDSGRLALFAGSWPRPTTGFFFFFFFHKKRRVSPSPQKDSLPKESKGNQACNMLHTDTSSPTFSPKISQPAGSPSNVKIERSTRSPRAAGGRGSSTAPTSTTGHPYVSRPSCHAYTESGGTRWRCVSAANASAVSYFLAGPNTAHPTTTAAGSPGATVSDRAATPGGPDVANRWTRAPVWEKRTGKG